MYDKLSPYLKHPKEFESSDTNFWNDPHISTYLLDAHLDPEFDGASRKKGFIEESVKWIEELVPSSDHKRLLDIGCGPGLYAERLSQADYDVTGIDFSKRSIEYAKDSARQKKLNIPYIYKNYLDMDFKDTFDFATFIYCDYGALSEEDRIKILKNIYQALTSGGKLLLDVFSLVKFNQFQEKNTWNFHSEGRFWSANDHLTLERQMKYPDNISLEQTIVMESQSIKNYNIWNKYYTKDSLIREAAEAGFSVVDIFGDVAGTPYTEESPTIAILAEKK